MAMVDLLWQVTSLRGGGSIHTCKIEARNDEDALIMEARDTGQIVIRQCNATAYYWMEDRQRSIPLYDDEGFGSLDDAKDALTEWYANHAPTLLMTLAA